MSMCKHVAATLYVLACAATPTSGNPPGNPHRDRFVCNAILNSELVEELFNDLYKELNAFALYHKLSVDWAVPFIYAFCVVFAICANCCFFKRLFNDLDWC